MTPEMVTDILRNLYSASGGDVPPTAVMSALSGLMWNETWAGAWAHAGTAAEAAADRGGSFDDINAAFNKAFADSLGWSDADFERFLQDNDLTSENAHRHQREDIDVWEWMAGRTR